MTQASYNIPNQTAAALRLDLNNHLLAIVSQNSGAVAPSVTFAYQFWADTGVSPPMLRQRNAANAAWIAIAQLSNFGLPSVQLLAATAATSANVGLAYTASTNPPTSGIKVIDLTINASTAVGVQPTFAANGDAAKNVKQYDNTGAKIPGVLVAGCNLQLFDDGTDWVIRSPFAGTGSVANNTLYEFKTNITANYTINTGSNALAVGPLTVATGVSLTVPTGSRLVVL